MIWTLSLIAPLALSGNATTTPVENDISKDGLSLQSVVPALDDLRVGGLLRTYFDIEDDELSATGEDIEGLRLYDAQVWVNAEAYGFDFFVRGDFAEASTWPPSDTGTGVSDFELRDAFVRKAFTEQVSMYLGQFKCPLVASGNMGDGNLGMIERTRPGQLFSMPGAYQPGIAVTFDEGLFHAKGVIQDGADEAVDGHGIVLRGEYSLNEGRMDHEGALDAPPGFNATFGVGYFTDDSDIGGDDFGSALALDGYATLDQFSFHAEIIAWDEELAANALGNADDDATSLTATVGYLFTPVWEGFVRVQNLDNEVDATQLGVGANYYVHNHAAKWQGGLSAYDDDDIDGAIFQIGLSIGLSQPSSL